MSDNRSSSVMGVRGYVTPFSMVSFILCQSGWRDKSGSIRLVGRNSEP